MICESNNNSYHVDTSPFFQWSFCSFFGGLVKHIENKTQSAKFNFAALGTCIMLNVPLTKTQQNFQGVISSAPQNYAKMNKITEG